MSELPSPTTPRKVKDTLRNLVLLVIVVVVLGAAAYLKTEYDEASQSAAQAVANAAYLVEERVLHNLRSTEFVVSQATILFADRANPKTAGKLDRLMPGLPEGGGLWLLDAEGRVAVQAAGIQAPMPRLQQAPFFRRHAEGAIHQVGPLLAGAGNPRSLLVVSTRIEDPNGTFVGVVAAVVDTKFIADLFVGLSLKPSSILTLISSKDEIIMRHPDAEKFVGTSPTLLPEIIANTPGNQGVIRLTSPLDGIERLIAFHRLPEYSAIVVAGVAVEEVFQTWWEVVATLLLSVSVASLLGAILLTLAFRSLAREEQTLLKLEAKVKQRTEEAEARAEEARRANDSKTRFLATASHDLRQPLQAAGMFVEVLGAQIKDPVQAKVVDRLRQSIEATNSLLTSLLDVSTLEAGRVRPNVSSFRLMPLLSGLVDQIEPEASKRGLSIGVVPTSVKVVSDPVLLERLLRNLLINAVRYTQKGGILVGCRHRGDRLAIEIYDTGIGIAPDKQEAVFEDFIRLDDPSQNKEDRGLGLGLGVVRRMAAILGHGLEIKSKPGHGSRFGVVVARG
ncbi:C4-dicarboxylate transport sensor protein dctB [Candidatus Terasakiella magnetica]|nr:C4-dicarboxylate transport sensor protein dctB [Candidatus Terasakiella magnetica]